jgi:sugar phosphate permease
VVDIQDRVPAAGLSSLNRCGVSRYIYIVVLVLAGEMVFGLPFHTSRFFRPTMLEVFGFTNTQLGDLFAIYGITAMLGYFPGGAIADHYSARTLLTTSLIATGLGGLYMATIPGPVEMGFLYGFWGITTIFLFWGALIRATREWGGKAEQGMAFGLLEGGRGIAAAVFASVLVTVLAFYMPDDATQATDAERLAGFRMVIIGYSVITIGIGVLAWILIPVPEEPGARRAHMFPNMGLVIRRPIIWAQAAVVVCAYCTYKAADYYSLYLVEVIGMDEVEGARVASWGAYIRAPAAIVAGLVADRFDATRSIGVIFGIAALAYFALSMIVPETTAISVVYLNLALSISAVFALRGIYFALLQETRTPRHITGAAVGMVSVIGFTPEIFFGPIAGRILDATPGAGGFHNLFALLAIIAACGVGVVVLLSKLRRHSPVA